MVNHYQSKKLYGRYLTRKDFRDEASYFTPSHLTFYKDWSNRRVRRFKGDIPNGAKYKQIEDIRWLYL